MRVNLVSCVIFVWFCGDIPQSFSSYFIALKLRLLVVITSLVVEGAGRYASIVITSLVVEGAGRSASIVITSLGAEGAGRSASIVITSLVAEGAGRSASIVITSLGGGGRGSRSLCWHCDHLTGQKELVAMLTL